MFDIKWIRENAEAFDRGLTSRGMDPAAGQAIALDEERRAILVKLQEAQARRNAASKQIGQAKANKDEETAGALMAEVAELKGAISAGEDEERRVDEAIA